MRKEVEAFSGGTMKARAMREKRRDAKFMERVKEYERLKELEYHLRRDGEYHLRKDGEGKLRMAKQESVVVGRKQDVTDPLQEAVRSCFTLYDGEIICNECEATGPSPDTTALSHTPGCNVARAVEILFSEARLTGQRVYAGPALPKPVQGYGSTLTVEEIERVVSRARDEEAKLGQWTQQAQQQAAWGASAATSQFQQVYQAAQNDLFAQLMNTNFSGALNLSPGKAKGVLIAEDPAVDSSKG